MRIMIVLMKTTMKLMLMLLVVAGMKSSGLHTICRKTALEVEQ